MQRAQGRPGAACTRSLVCIVESTRVRTTGSTGHPAFPCAMVYGLSRALVSANFARMCERAVLTNRPSLDLSPSVLEGLESLSGSVGQTGVFLNPNSCMGLL